MGKTFKEIKEELLRDYNNKLKDLKQSYIKYAKFSENDIIIYRGVKYNLAYKYDNGSTINIGVIKDVFLNDKDEMSYNVYLLNDNPDKGIVEIGSSTYIVKENNIIKTIGKVPMTYERFVNCFINN